MFRRPYHFKGPEFQPPLNFGFRCSGPIKLIKGLSRQRGKFMAAYAHGDKAGIIWPSFAPPSNTRVVCQPAGLKMAHVFKVRNFRYRCCVRLPPTGI